MPGPESLVINGSQVLHGELSKKEMFLDIRTQSQMATWVACSLQMQLDAKERTQPDLLSPQLCSFLFLSVLLHD